MLMPASRCSIRHLRLATALLATLLQACGGSDASSGMSTAPAPTSTQLTADFDSIQANIFTPLCASCHSGANAAAGLRLDAAHSYNDLVNVPSTEQPALLRVKPGDPTHSFLVLHLQSEGDGAPASDIPFVEQWITDGAMPGAAMASGAAFQLATLEPEDGDTTQGSPARIVMGFTQELNSGSLNATAVRLEHIEEGGVLTVSSALTIPGGNARVLQLTPEQPLPPGNYQVVLDLRAGALVSSLDGRPLPVASRADRAIISRFRVEQNPQD